VMNLDGLLIYASKWTDYLTAWSTFALAALTLALVVTTGWLVLKTREGIRKELGAAADDLEATREATRAAQAAAQRQLELSYRPLLIDVAGPEPDAPPTVGDGGRVAERDPPPVSVQIVDGLARVSLAMRNVGNGLAEIHPEEIQFFGAAPGNRKACYARPHRIPAGETTRLYITSQLPVSQPSDELISCQVTVPYSDFNSAQTSIATVKIRLSCRSGGDSGARFRGIAC
jgi:hypothetical protein